VGALALGIHDRAGNLIPVGVVTSFNPARREELTRELAPLRAAGLAGHPWLGLGGEWSGRLPWSSRRGVGGSPHADPSWEPLRPVRVCEVAYGHLRGRRFRSAARFLRWRPDKSPQDCRWDQLAARPAPELARLLPVERAAALIG
jgi:ATP-dependent DNA ligase